MAIEILDGNGVDLLHARIAQQMTLEDQRQLEALARAAIDRGTAPRLLVELEGFSGWTRDAGWGDDLAYMAEYADRVLRIAIVGDARWRDEALAFVGNGFRPTEVRYFEPPALQEADAWVRG